MRELIEFLAKAIVDSPDQVEVREMEGEKTTILELKVAKEDVGKVIGKQGRIASALRTILRASASKQDKRVVLEILD